MNEFRFRMFPDAEDKLKKDPKTGAMMKAEADKVRKRVRASSRFTISHRGGIGPRGAFGQVIMRGQGALIEEFGGQGRPAKAPLRSALRGG